MNANELGEYHRELNNNWIGEPRKKLPEPINIEDYMEIPYTGTDTKGLENRIETLEMLLKATLIALDEIKTNTAFLCWDHDKTHSRREQWERDTGNITTPSVIHIERPAPTVPKPPIEKKKGFSLFGKKDDKDKWE